MEKDLLVLTMVMSGIISVLGFSLATHSLPEESAANFNALSNMSMLSDFAVLKNATSQDNTYSYAINHIAAKAVAIATKDSDVAQILNESKGTAVTIAGVQPTVLEDNAGNLDYSSSGQVIITSNWQNVAGQPYKSAKSFQDIAGKSIESQQRIWDIVVDMDQEKVISIQPEPQKSVIGTVQRNTIVIGSDMFVPDIAKVSPGTEVTWIGESPLQHNISGTFVINSGKQIHVDSGFFGYGVSYKYLFSEPGVFNYECNIHSQEGMKGTILVSNQ